MIKEFKFENFLLVPLFFCPRSWFSGPLSDLFKTHLSLHCEFHQKWAVLSHLSICSSSQQYGLCWQGRSKWPSMRCVSFSRPPVATPATLGRGSGKGEGHFHLNFPGLCSVKARMHINIFCPQPSNHPTHWTRLRTCLSLERKSDPFTIERNGTNHKYEVISVLKINSIHMVRSANKNRETMNDYLASFTELGCARAFLYRATQIKFSDPTSCKVHDCTLTR